jgi:hypothetical protein
VVDTVPRKQYAPLAGRVDHQALAVAV